MADDIRIGVIGIHSFAHAHLQALLDLQAEGSSRLVAAVAHQRHLDPAWAAELAGRGVALVDDLDHLLARDDLDLVTVPVGIQLHTAFACRVLASGRACFLEKPAAGSLADADAITAAAEAAGRPVFVGFQDLFHPTTHKLKQVVVGGALGRLRRIVVTASWPRAHSYYARNSWAGRLAIDGIAVRDSPANNACAHFLMLALFLAGAAPGDCAEPLSVDGALWRAYPIESFDTASLRFGTATGIEVVFNVSHVAASYFGPLIRIEGDAGIAEIDFSAKDPIWRLPAGRSMPYVPEVAQRFRHTLQVMRGGTAPVCLLRHARAHCAAIDLIHRRLTIASMPGDAIGREADQLTVAGLDETLRLAHQRGALVAWPWMAGSLAAAV